MQKKQKINKKENFIVYQRYERIYLIFSLNLSIFIKKMKDDLKDHIKEKTLEDDETSSTVIKKKFYEIFSKEIMR